MTEVKGEILNVSNLATTTAALTTVENKIPNVSHLVKTLTITQKLMIWKRKLLIMIIGNKYVNTSEFNKFPAQKFAARLK